MNNKRYVYALPKPDLSQFDSILSQKSDNSDDNPNRTSLRRSKRKKAQTSKKRKRVVDSDNEEDSDVIVISDITPVKEQSPSEDDEEFVDSEKSSSSSSEEEFEVTDGVVKIAKRKRNKSSPKSTKENRAPQKVIDDDSDSDDEIPIKDLEQFSKNDPALQKAREANALLLRKRQEVLDQEKEIRQRASRMRRAEAFVPSEEVHEYKFAQTSSERTAAILRETEAVVEEQRKVSIQALKAKEGILLKFRLPKDTNARRETFIDIHVDPSKPFEEAFVRFCEQAGKPRNEVIFMVDGENLSSSDTAKDLDLENEDLVEVKYS